MNVAISEYGNLEEKLTFTTRFLQPGDKVLEIGCGTGALVEALNDAGYQAEGLDLYTDSQRNIFCHDLFTSSLPVRRKYRLVYIYYPDFGEKWSLLKQLFVRVCEVLTVDGVFLFDLHKHHSFPHDYQNVFFKDDSQKLVLSKSLKKKRELVIEKLKVDKARQTFDHFVDRWPVYTAKEIRSLTEGLFNVEGEYYDFTEPVLRPLSLSPSPTPHRTILHLTKK